MKKKQDSLFEKLKEENFANSQSATILEEVDEQLKFLNKDSELFIRIEKIKKLQLDNSLPSSNEIYEILNNEFLYNYPFHYRIYSDESIQEETLKLSDILINHIKREAILNQTKPHLINFTKSLTKKQLLEGKLNKNPYKYLINTISVVITLITIIIASIINTWLAVAILFLCGVIYILSQSILKKLFYQSDKDEIERLKKIIQSNLKVLKSNAYNRYT